MVEKKTLWLHCGTHKTGTTSIQKSFLDQREILREENCLYPASGLALYGHHNLAWELRNDTRFSPSLGTISDLKKEISNSKCDVIISSEDFEGIIRDTKSMLAFSDIMRTIDYETKIVICLRRQDDYLISLYLELLKHGYSRGFRSFVKEAIDAGAIVFRDSEFQFDYEVILDNLAKIGCQYLLLPYSKKIDIVKSFCELLDCKSPAEDASYENISLSVSESHRLFRSNISEIVNVDCQNIEAGLVIDGLKPDISANLRARLFERFNQQNMYYLPSEFWGDEQIPVDPEPGSILLDEIF